MKLFKINYSTPNGLFTTKKYFASKSEAVRCFPYLVIGIYEINEVGAIIG